MVWVLGLRGGAEGGAVGMDCTGVVVEGGDGWGRFWWWIW